MIPITIIVRGLESEPIDCLKVAASTASDGIKYYFMQTADRRLISVKEDDVLLYIENTPSDSMFERIDKMIEAGNKLLESQTKKYIGGVETV